MGKIKRTQINRRTKRVKKTRSQKKIQRVKRTKRTKRVKRSKRTRRSFLKNKRKTQKRKRVLRGGMFTNRSPYFEISSKTTIPKESHCEFCLRNIKSLYEDNPRGSKQKYKDLCCKCENISNKCLLDNYKQERKSLMSVQQEIPKETPKRDVLKLIDKKRKEKLMNPEIKAKKDLLDRQIRDLERQIANE